MRTPDDTEKPTAGQQGPANHSMIHSDEPPRSTLPTVLALLIVAAVWALGCWWSFTEQTAFARSHHFAVPELLPLILDGMATALAGVAYAASLDGRPAIGARVGTAVAVAISAASNGLWAAERSGQDVITIGLAVVVPCTAMLAFEVLLGELRRQVQRRRGDPAPVRIPHPRMVRWVLAPVSTFTTWRRLVLDLTALTPTSTPHSLPSPASAAQGSTEASRAETTEAPQPGPVADPEPADRDSEPPPARPAGVPVATGDRTPQTAWPPPAEPVATAVAGPDIIDDRAAQEPPTRQTSAPAGRARPQEPETAAEHTQPGMRPVPDPHGVSVGDERVANIAGMLRRGEEPTGEQVGDLYGCSARTGRRLIERAREMLADHPHLQVVGGATGHQ